MTFSAANQTIFVSNCDTVTRRSPHGANGLGADTILG